MVKLKIMDLSMKYTFCNSTQNLIMQLTQLFDFSAPDLFCLTTLDTACTCHKNYKKIWITTTKQFFFFLKNIV